MAWVCLAFLALCLAITYRVLWNRRYGPPAPRATGAVRTRGRIVHLDARDGPVAGAACGQGAGALPSGRFELALDDGRKTTVRFAQPALAGLPRGRLRASVRVTVDGLLGATACYGRETLYRSIEWAPLVDATRVSLGSWPRARWIVPAASIALLVALIAGPLELWLQHANRRAEDRDCPPGMVLKAEVGCFDMHFRCTLAYETPAQIAARIRARQVCAAKRALDRRARAEAISALSSIDRPPPAASRPSFKELDRWVLQRTALLVGGPRGSRSGLGAAENRLGRLDLGGDANDNPYGLRTGWHEGGALAFVGQHDGSAPRGTWTYWDVDSQLVAHGDAGHAAGRWVFWEPAGMVSCEGRQETIERWLAERANDRERPCEIRCLRPARSMLDRGPRRIAARLKTEHGRGTARPEDGKLAALSTAPQVRRAAGEWQPGWPGWDARAWAQCVPAAQPAQSDLLSPTTPRAR